MFSIAHPRSPDHPPETPGIPPPYSAPPAVGIFYIILFTILFFTLRFPKSTATPDLGVGGVGGLGTVGADQECRLCVYEYMGLDAFLRARKVEGPSLFQGRRMWPQAS